MADRPALERDDLQNPEWCAAVDHAGAAALGAMLAGHTRCAVHELSAAAPLGYAAYVRMMLGWIDSLLAALGLPGDVSEIGTLTLQFAKPDQTEIDTDTVPAPARWAGRLMAARALQDDETCVALVNAGVGDDSFGERVLAVLTGVSSTLRHNPRSSIAAELRGRHTGSSPC